MSIEKLRVRCPCCGQMTDLDRMAEVNPNPAHVQVFLQTFGGKNPVPQIEGGPWKRIGRGKAPGKNVYEEITGKIDESQLTTIKSFFVKRAEAFLQGEKK